LFHHEIAFQSKYDCEHFLLEEDYGGGAIPILVAIGGGGDDGSGDDNGNAFGCHIRVSESF